MKTFSKLAIALLLSSGICQATEAGNNTEALATFDKDKIEALENTYRDADNAARKAKEDRWNAFYDALDTDKNREFLLQNRRYIEAYTFDKEPRYTEDTLKRDGETGRVYAKIVSCLAFQNLNPAMKELYDEMNEVCEEAWKQVPERLSQEAVERLYAAADEARIDLLQYARRADEQAQ